MAQQQTRGAAASITRTMPPANFDVGSDHTLRAMGLVGGHLHGHYSIVGGTHYVWFRQGDAAPDPGAYVAALGGLTGVETVLPASGQTDAQVATAVAGALTGAGFTASALGADVTVNSATWTPGAISYTEAAYQGMVGVHDVRIEDGITSAGNINSLRLAQIDPADLPATDFLVNGIAVRIGDVHTSNFALGLYQGGAADDDLNGCTYLGALGTTDTANGANVWEYVQSSGIVVDPTAGRLWIAFSTTLATSELEFVISSQAQGSTSSFVIHNTNQCIVNASGGEAVSTTDPATFPASLTATGATEQGIPPFRMAIQEISTLQSNMAPEFDFGTMVGKLNGQRAADPGFTGSSGNDFIVGNSYNVPATMLGLELAEMYLAYNTYNPGDNMRLFLAVGGDAIDDVNNAFFYDLGQTSGSGVGWHSSVAPAGVPLAAGTRVWMILKHDGLSGTQIAFAPTGAANQFEGFEWGAAPWYNGEATESEYAATNPFVTVPTTTIDFDQAVADPIGATFFDGNHIQQSNNVGTRGRAVTRGWA